MAFLKYVVLLLSLRRSDSFTKIRNGSFHNEVSQLTTLPTPVATKCQRTPNPCIRNNKDKKTTCLYMNSNSSSQESLFSQVSIPYSVALAIFLGFAAFLAPGSFGAEQDNAMLQAYFDNPLAPGWNEIFYAEFNLLGIIPILMSCLLFPQASPMGLPPTPFLVASAGFGYFGLGKMCHFARLHLVQTCIYFTYTFVLFKAPYMIFRKTPRSEVSLDDFGWVVRNVFENKLFNWAVVALCIYQYGSAIVPLLQNFADVQQGYVDLVTTSKFASVSTMDLAILSVTAASVIPLDLKYRRPQVEESEANLIAASTLLLPILGSAIYCALRPNLPQE